MAVANRMDIKVLEEDLDALSDEVAKLGNSPDEQVRMEVGNRIRRIRAALEKLEAALRSESPGPVVEVADKVIEPVEDLLGEHPIATVALGLGLGLVVGFTWRRH